LPYLTRKLGAEGFGELSYYLTILALFSIFIGLSQEGAVTRYFYFYGNKAVDLIVRAGYLYNIAFSALSLVVAWFLKSEVVAYIIIIAMFNSFLSVQLALRQAQKQPLPYIIIQFLSSFSMVLLTIIMLEFVAGDKVVNRLLALLLSGLFVFLITYLFINKKFRIRRKFSLTSYKAALIYIFSFGIPLILHQLSFFMKGQVDRIFIYKLYTSAELGVYSAGVQIASVLTIFLWL
jgi:O-antigen/teichoic acid export membrane protein